MKIICLIVLLGLSPGFARAEDAKNAAPEGKAPLKLLSTEEQTKLLAERLEGSLGGAFGPFASMFMLRSRVEIGTSIGLKDATSGLTETQLQAVFPDFYKPSLKELLDTIALQTSTSWSYRKEDQFVLSKTPDKTEDEMVFFTFAPMEPKAKAAKPFSLELAKGWRTEDHGYWMACIPPTFPVGMDIYEMGTYSAANPQEEEALFAKVRHEVALQWATRVKNDAKGEDLKPAKVGGYEALHFDAEVPSRDGRKLHWRHWVFMVDNACYFIVSTIFPEMEEQLFPEVEKMLSSFKVAKK